MKIMKKISLILITICSLFSIKDIKAGTLDTTIRVDWMSGVYANRKVGNLNYYNQVGYIYTNGILSYCLESTKFITEDVYHSTTDFSSKLTEEQRSYIELLAYYGHGYMKHNSKEYYMAAQELIWEYLEGVDVYFTTESKGNGKVIDIEPYKQNILYLVRTHSTLPSFKDQTYYAKEGQSQILKDTHYILERYEFDKNYPELTLGVNQLTFSSSTYGIYSYGMHLKMRNPISFLYFKNDSQTIGSFGLRNNQHFQFKVINQPMKHRLKLQKKDGITGELIKQEKIQFKIKNVETDEYLEHGKIYSTNKDGVFYTEEIEAGTYQIEEITPPQNYYGKKEFLVTIDASTPFVEESFYTEFKDEPFRSKIKIQKTGKRIKTINQGNISYQEESLPGVSFDVLAKGDITDLNYTYYKDGEVVDQLITDESGNATTKDLPYGTYCLIETKTLKEFELNTTCQEVVLDKPTTNEVEIKSLDLQNERKKTSFELYKKGEVFNLESSGYTYLKEPLANIKFRLYAGEDIVENGQVLIEKDELIQELITNQEGYIKIDDLPYGAYYLEEETPTIYEEGEIVSFVLDENHLKETFSMVNKLKKGKLTIQKIDETTHKPLAGVKFGIYNQEGILVYTGITDEQGKIILDDLVYGDYVVKEIEALKNYQKNSQSYPFTLDEEHPSFELEVSNQKIAYPNTTTEVPVSFLKSILVFVISVCLLKRYLS